MSGEAWWIDTFGNVQTNIGPDELRLAGAVPGRLVRVRVGTTVREVPWVESYGAVEEGTLLIHVDSAGLIALAVRGGRADEQLSLAVGSSVSLAGSTEG